jgi:hypothetical protein
MLHNYKIPRIPYRRQLYYGSNGEVFCNTSGELAMGLAQVYGPSTEEIRSMLLRIRRRQQWSQASLAAVLGVPKESLRRWEDGSRQPCSSARKLIWFVHALVFEPNSLLKDLDSLVTWGKAGREELLMTEEEDGH